ncbi:MAG: hypothetical protein JSR77_01390 [Planctomycetes bacterium]|nr:hypothetical protein [Planctomycetota bacterium]
MKTTVLSLACLLALVGCNADPSKGTLKLSGKPTAAQQAALLDRVKGLEGTWEMTDDKGQKSTLVFKTMAAGSAVREIMFPGSPHEMTNLYHMDGSSLVVTHYCAAGNEPTMRATAAEGDSIHFTTDHVSNLGSKDETYMGELTLVFKGPNQFEQHWKSITGGQVSEGPAFVLARKQ